VKRPATFFPEVHEDNPYLDPNVQKDKEIVYLSKYARTFLDGPLKHDVYIIPVTFDLKRESLGAARVGNFTPMALPIKKYIK
jgi:hypothetical protein